MYADEKQFKLRKVGRMVTVVMTILQILLILAAVSVVVIYLFRSTIFDFNGAVLFLSSLDAPNPLDMPFAIVIMALVWVKLGLVFASLVLGKRIFQDMAREGTPFRTVQVHRMKTIALLIFLSSFINLFSIQLSTWVVALLIWVMALVFDYGCHLQRESDETL